MSKYLYRMQSLPPRINSIRPAPFTLLLAALSTLGMGLILIRQVNYGVLLSIDSASYISTARNLLHGNGFLAWYGYIYIDSPPLFPLMLALTGIFGTDPIDTAGYLNAAAFGLTIFATTLWLNRLIQSRFLVIWALSAMVLSPFLVKVSTFAWTEPLFILFLILSLISIHQFLSTRYRSYLFLAAIFTALCWLTRYVGVSVAAAGMLLLLIFPRDHTLTSRIKNTGVYTAISAIPISVWLIRNYLTAGTLTGRTHSDDLPLLYSFHNALFWILEWILGPYGVERLKIWSQWVPGETIIGNYESVAGVLIMTIILVVVLFGAGYLFIRLRSEEEIENLLSVTVVAVFIFSYTVWMSLLLALTGIAASERFLAPIYVLMVIITVLFLDGCFRYDSEKAPLGRLRMLTMFKLPAIRIMTALIVAWLCFWVWQHVTPNIDDINRVMLQGDGYSSREWSESEIVQYIDSELQADYIFSNAAGALYLNSDARSEFIQLPADDMLSWIYRIQDNRERIYVAWVYDHSFRPMSYGITDIQALSELQPIAELADGAILKVKHDYWRFDVFHNENQLTYLKEPCTVEETNLAFFLHVTPVNKNDLPEHRQEFDFDRLNFKFETYGNIVNGKCMATVDLPDYDIMNIETGQWLPSERGKWIWVTEFPSAR